MGGESKYQRCANWGFFVGTVDVGVGPDPRDKISGKPPAGFRQSESPVGYYNVPTNSLTASIAWVPKDMSLFNREGMSGWFEQSHKEVGTLKVDVTVALRTVVLWDSHPEGRLGHIIQLAPRHQQYFLRNYFWHVQPLKCMIVRIATGIGGCITRSVVH